MIDPSNCPEPIENGKILCEISDSNSDSDFQKDYEQFSALPSKHNIPEQVISPSKCPNLIYYLKKFLDYTKDLFECVSPNFTTQSNESLNAIKAKMAQKNKNWSLSFEARMSLAVLQKNNPYLYYEEFLEKLSLPKLNDESQKVIQKYIKILQKRKKNG